MYLQRDDMQLRLITGDNNYFESDYTYAVMYNHKADRYDMDTIENITKEREAGIRPEGWVIVDVFWDYTQAVEYIGKNR